MVPTERLFTMPSFEGLRLIRLYLVESPHLSVEEIVAAIQVAEADAMSLDFEASRELHSIVPVCELETNRFYRQCIRGVVLARFPIWVKAMRLGRRVFASKLGGDDYSIFDAAGLLAPQPDEDVVSWWDTIGHEVRMETDLEKMAQARAAERLSWESEKKRMLESAIEADPVWVGLDDNTAGYDVLAYERGDAGFTNKLVEVKSTVASPLRFFVTRNEWGRAQKSRDSYYFHIWDMQKVPPVLFVRTVAEVEPHIPTDNEDGKWAHAEIPLGA